MGALSYKTWRKALVADSPYSDDESNLSGLIGGAGAEGTLSVNPTRPPFYLWYVPSMQEEPILKLGMGALKGLTSMAEYTVTCSDNNVREWVEEQLKAWRSVGLHAAMEALDYGFAGFEMMYRDNEKGQPSLSDMISRQVGRVYPRTLQGNIVGCHFRRYSSSSQRMDRRDPTKDLYLANPKSFWCVHNRNIDRINGASQFIGAHLPFLEMRRYMGVKDIRAVWTRKFSVSPIVIHYPRGSQTLGGQQVSNLDIASLIVERYRATGAVLIEKSSTGAPSFEFDPIPGTTDATGLFEVSNQLDDEMLMGIEIHPEIIRSNGTGSYNGREIPMLACLSRTTFIANDLTQQFADQVLRPIAYAEFDCEHFSIETLPLQDTLLKRGGNGDGEGKGLTEQPPTPGKNAPPPMLPAPSGNQPQPPQ